MARINSAMLLTTDVMEAVGAALTKGKPAYPKLWKQIKIDQH